jgi:hypothetical protein
MDRVIIIIIIIRGQDSLTLPILDLIIVDYRIILNYDDL